MHGTLQKYFSNILRHGSQAELRGQKHNESKYRMERLLVMVTGTIIISLIYLSMFYTNIFYSQEQEALAWGGGYTGLRVCVGCEEMT